MDSPAEIFFPATGQDAAAVAAFINSAYRGESSRAGWTTEADRLGGQRTDAGAVSELIEKPDSTILVCRDGEGLLGTIHIEREGDLARFGMLAVRPARQGRGTGKRLVGAAERFAVDAWNAGHAEMAVLTFRLELIAFYGRLGYARTGRCHDFPQDPRFGIPKVSGLRFEILEKRLSA